MKAIQGTAIFWDTEVQADEVSTMDFYDSCWSLLWAHIHINKISMKCLQAVGKLGLEVAQATCVLPASLQFTAAQPYNTGSLKLVYHNTLKDKDQ